MLIAMGTCRPPCARGREPSAPPPRLGTHPPGEPPRCRHREAAMAWRDDDYMVVMGMLADRQDELARARTQTVNRLHRLLLELFPGGAKQFLSAQQARAMLATARPRDLPGRTRRRLASELITELEAIGKK